MSAVRAFRLSDRLQMRAAQKSGQVMVTLTSHGGVLRTVEETSNLRYISAGTAQRLSSGWSCSPHKQHIHAEEYTVDCGATRSCCSRLPNKN